MSDRNKKKSDQPDKKGKISRIDRLLKAAPALGALTGATLVLRRNRYLARVLGRAPDTASSGKDVIVGAAGGAGIGSLPSVLSGGSEALSGHEKKAQLSPGRKARILASASNINR